jgi:SAM-dependent methyltransferase
MINDRQKNNKIWTYYQDKGEDRFDTAYPRLEYLAKRCPPGAIVLNVGAGSGYLESVLNRRGAIAHTLDPIESTITHLNERQGMDGRAKQGYCDAIPFPHASFDYVVMTEVLEHIHEDYLEGSLREVMRVLKRGGRFIGTVPYKENLIDSEVFCPHCASHFHRWGHVQSFDLAALKSLFENCGFEVEQLQVRAFPDFSRSGIKPFLKAVFRYVLGRMGESIVGPNIYFVCRPK